MLSPGRGLHATRDQLRLQVVRALTRTWVTRYTRPAEVQVVRALTRTWVTRYTRPAELQVVRALTRTWDTRYTRPAECRRASLVLRQCRFMCMMGRV